MKPLTAPTTERPGPKQPTTHKCLAQQDQKTL